MNNLLKNCGIDALLVTSRHNIGYVSGFWGSRGAVLLTENYRFLFVDFRYITQAKNTVRGFQISEISGSLEESVSKTALGLGVKRIGFEDQSLTVYEFKKYKELFKNCELIGVSENLDRLREIKTPKEIENIKIAAHIADSAFSKTIKSIKEGVTEKEVACLLEYNMKKEGADGFSFDTIAVSGKNSALVHGVPTHKKIENGDFLLMDFGAYYKNYASDMTRTVCIGKPTQKMSRVYNTVLEAQAEALKVIKEGAVCSEVDGVARKIIYDAGYKGHFGHALGHSVGVLIHENPNFSPLCNEKLKANMVLSVEPGIYIENEFGVRIEDLILVTENGFENFTKSQKNMIIL